MWGCLSAVAPCKYAETFKEPCHTCRVSAERQERQALEDAIRKARYLLERQGYTVTPPRS